MRDGGLREGEAREFENMADDVRCRICALPPDRRGAIEAALADGSVATREIARRFREVSRSGLARHRDHMPVAAVPRGTRVVLNSVVEPTRDLVAETIEPMQVVGATMLSGMLVRVGQVVVDRWTQDRIRAAGGSLAPATPEQRRKLVEIAQRNERLAPSPPPPAPPPPDSIEPISLQQAQALIDRDGTAVLAIWEKAVARERQSAGEAVGSWRTVELIYDAHRAQKSRAKTFAEQLRIVVAATAALRELRRRGAPVRWAEEQRAIALAAPSGGFSARGFITQMAARGIRLSVERGEVLASPSGMLDNVAVAAIRDHKLAIISALSTAEVVA
jgi:hypothetical protein